MGGSWGASVSYYLASKWWLVFTRHLSLPYSAIPCTSVHASHKQLSYNTQEPKVKSNALCVQSCADCWP